MTDIQAIRKALEGIDDERGWIYVKDSMEAILNEMLNVMEEQAKVIEAFKIVEKSRWQAAFKNMEQFNQHQSPTRL